MCASFLFTQITLSRGALDLPSKRRNLRKFLRSNFGDHVNVFRKPAKVEAPQQSCCPNAKFHRKIPTRKTITVQQSQF